MKNNRKIIIVIPIIVILLIVTILFVGPLLTININLIGNKKMELDYGEKYSEPGYKGSILNRDITNKIKVTNNIKEDIGNYEVKYSFKFLFYNVTKKRKITVADLTGPDIVLKGDKELNLTINTEYVEPGFETQDKVDGDLTSSTKVSNNIDITKVGSYEVKYEVEDKAGNKTTEVRKVKVERLNPTLMSIEDYSLDGWYEDTKLKKTKDYGDEYYNKITIVGDSNTMNMYSSGYIKGIRAWALPCLHAESMHTTEINLYGYSKKMKLLDAVDKYKPEIMILNFGSFSTDWISEEVFIEKANSMLDLIKEKSPNTKVILISLYPIRKGANINSFEQGKINRFNFLLLEMANKHNLKYLDVQEVLKASDGYAKDEYFTSDKFHLTGSGFKTIKNYIRTHALEEQV